VEAGESAFQALRRELREELGIELTDACPQLKIRHHYPERSVLLDVWRVECFDGIPTGAENQPVRWVSADELPLFPFPAANRAIITAARLPDRYAILDIADRGDDAWPLRLNQLIENGLSLIQLRAPALDSKAYSNLAEQAIGLCRASQVRLLLHGSPDLARDLGAAGVHLPSAMARSLSRRPLDESHWISCACHNLEELRQAERIGADFAVVSPILPTATHPGASLLGWNGLQTLAEQASLPVFALGGMRSSHVSLAKKCGAQGIAAIRGFLDTA